MSVFDFYTNNKSEAYMLEIAKEMIERFGIPYEEAIGRLNDWFKGSDLTDPYDLIYHREAFFWANHIYYDYDVNWRDPEWMASHVARPSAYPPKKPKKIYPLGVTPKLVKRHRRIIRTFSDQAITYSNTVLSEQACLMLKNAGWYPERRIDITEQRKDLLKFGITINPIIEDFLERFDRIIIPIESPIQDTDRKTNSATIHLHVSHFLYELYPQESLLPFEVYIGETLVLIGYRGDYPLFLYISTTGKMYGSSKDGYYFYASSPVAFFNKISAGDETYTPVFRYDESQ